MQDHTPPLPPTVHHPSLPTTPTKIGFVLLSNSLAPLPSTRIAVLNMLPFLRQAGFEPEILSEPASGDEQPEVSPLFEQVRARGIRIVLFQKVHGASVEALARRLASIGVRTVYCVCDLVRPEMVRATDATVAVTEHLRSLYPGELQAKIHVVHDGIENPQPFKADWGEHKASPRRRLRAVLVTSNALSALPVIGTPPPWLEVRIVGRYAAASLRRLQETRWKLLQQPPGDRLEYLGFLMNRRIRRIAWDAATVYEHMLAADIGIIPIQTSGPDALPGWSVKSENRLTMKMALGLPVVATPIPSYRPVVVHGDNGLLAETRSEWLTCLDALRDPATRQRIGSRARASVVERYSKDEQARRLVAVLRRLLVKDAIHFPG